MITVEHIALLCKSEALNRKKASWVTDFRSLTEVSPYKFMHYIRYGKISTCSYIARYVEHQRK